MQSLVEQFFRPPCHSRNFTLSRVICFNNRDTRPGRRQQDKRAAIREVLDKRVELMPLIYSLLANQDKDSFSSKFAFTNTMQLWAPGRTRNPMPSWNATGTKLELTTLIRYVDFYFSYTSSLSSYCLDCTINVRLGFGEVHIKFMNNTESVLSIWICKHVLDLISQNNALMHQAKHEIPFLCTLDFIYFLYFCRLLAHTLVRGRQHLGPRCYFSTS